VTKKFGLGLAGLVLCCETWSCHAGHPTYLEGHRNFSSTSTTYDHLYSHNIGSTKSTKRPK